MKCFKRLLTAVALMIITLASCSQPAAPSSGSDLLTYTVSGSDTSLKADITYIDDNNELISLQDQTIPWTVTLDLDNASFFKNAYLKAEIPQVDVFVPYLSGTTDVAGFEEYKLHDADVDFISRGVSAGDIVYNDPDTLKYSIISSIYDVDSLNLAADLFDANSMDYYIYSIKTLTTEIDYNGTIENYFTCESERSLSCLVRSTLDR